MMSRLYYDDPLQAAYMAREFGVKVKALLDADWLLSWYDLLSDDFIEPYRLNKKFKLYVHPDSEHIFEPIEGDLGNALEINEAMGHNSYESCWWDNDEKKWWFDDDGRREAIDAQIIFRDKHFFYPEKDEALF